jgi:hypothetical protein
MAAMETTEECIEDDGGVAARRARARNLLPQITQEVKQSLKDAGIEMDVFLMIPRTGDAVATFGTVIDPPDEVWARVGEIVCSVLRKTVGLGPARCRELACATTADQSGYLISADLTGIPISTPMASVAAEADAQ